MSDNASAPLVSGSPETSRAETAGRVALWIVFLAAAGFRWSVAGRGLDLTDESFALLAAGHPEEMRAWPSLFFGYTAPLFTLAGGDIALMRRLGLVLFLAAGAVLARGTARWLQGEPGALKAGSLFTVVGLGSLVYYSRGISVPNYNHVTACGLAMGFGLLLVALRSEAGHGRLALIGSGFGLASAAASKPPAILALIAAGLWLIARRQSTGGLIWLLAGVATAWAVPLTIHSPREAFDAVKTGVEVFQVRGDRYAFGEALGVYAIQAFQLLGQTAEYIALPLLAALTARAPGAWFSRWPRSLTPLVVLFVVLLFAGALPGGRSAARSGRTTAAILAAIIVCAGPGRALFVRMARPDRWPVLLAALVLPIVGVLATNTNFSSALLLFMGPWFLLVPICMTNSTFGGAERLVRSAAPALIAAFASTSAPYTSPYGLTAPFSEQTVPTTLGQPPTSILTDRQTARFLGRLASAARECGFSPGQDIIGLLEMPGFVFALGGVAPATPYLSRYGTGFEDAVSLALSIVPEARLRRSFVLVNDHAIRLGSFSIAGKRIPDDYDVCFDRDGPSKYGNMRVRLLRPRMER